MAAKFGDPQVQSRIPLVLKAGNGEIIATSEIYKSKASAKNGIESVRENAKDAEVVDTTGE